MAGKAQKRLKVLQLVKTSFGATWAWRQMRELVNLGVEVHVAVPPGGPLIAKYREVGVHVHEFQLDFPTRSPHLIPRLFQTFRDLVNLVNPDIIHSHFVGTTLTMRLALGQKPRYPRIFQVPGPLHLEHRLFRLLELSTASHQDFWIGSCKWTCNCYRQLGITEDRVFLSYYGTDIDQFASPVQGKLRKEIGCSESTKIVGMVAFMYKPRWYLGQSRGLKGHEDLIDALAICKREGLNILGVFIGGAWQHATNYEQRVRQYGKQHCGDDALFLGNRYDVPTLYPDFNLAVHPSHSENVGGAVESLLMGIPTIASDVGGFPDVVVPEETGWLVPPKNPQKLAETIQVALNNREKAYQFAVAGQALVTELFDVQSTAKQVLDVYHRVLS